MRLGRSRSRRLAKSGGKHLGLRAGGGSRATPYPTFDVARPDKWDHDWDEKTRALILRRIHEVPGYRFFTSYEAALLEAICSRLLPQDDRRVEERVPIAPWIDARLDAGEGYGYRYEEMPSDGEAYRRGIAALDRTASLVGGTRFVDLPATRQDDLVRSVAAGTAPAEAWEGVPMRRFFSMLVSDVVSIYYAHPAAWAEIGFNGPSSPRGHMRLDLGRHDPWEAEEKRPRPSIEIVRRAPGGRGNGGEVATH